MSSAWTITCASAGITAASFESLGLGNLRRTLLSQAADRCTFTAPGADFDGEALFPYKASVTIYKDGVAWYTGICTSIPRQGTANDERITYELAGPWWYLEHCVYYQTWKLYESGALNDSYKTRCILNQAYDGSAWTTGQQIRDSIAIAISLGAPMAIGTIDSGFVPPMEEVVGITCADVIVRQLRLSPDWLTWFDYSYAVPVFHARAIAALTGTTLTYGPETTVSAIAITPRYDLQIPGIEVIFEKTVSVTIAGQATTVCSVSRQRAGDWGAIDAMLLTMPLAGSEAWNVARIETEDWPSPLTDKNWIKAHYPSLKDEADSPWNVLSVTRTRKDTGATDTLPRILLKGSEVPEWLTSVEATEVIVTVKISRTRKGKDGVVVAAANEQPIVFSVISTDALSKDYWKQDSADVEAEPTGFAAALYAAWGRLQFDGQIVLEEDECSPYSIGSKLNIAGGRTEWSAMDAMIQQVDQDIDSGTTTLVIGPQRRVSPGDLAAFLSARRSFQSTRRHKERSTGEVEDADASVQGGGKPGDNEPCAHDAGDPEHQTYTQYSGTSAVARIKLDASEIAAVTDYKVFQKKTQGGIAVSAWDFFRFTT